MAEPMKTKAFVIRDFYDVGTGEIFDAETTVDIEKGAFANYAAAGLVRAPDEDRQVA